MNMPVKSENYSLDTDNYDSRTKWFLDTLETQAESDRGVVLVCATYLEDLLGRLLVAFFKLERMFLEGQDVHESRTRAVKSLLKGNLSNFAPRIELAFALGLIEKWQRDDLDKIRDIRNTFAHKLEVIDFSDEEVRKLILSLRTASRSEEKPEREMLDKKASRKRFEVFSAFLGGVLQARISSLEESGTIEDFWKRRRRELDITLGRA